MSENLNFSVPRESYLKLFLRFLKFGLLAWGGPVAQIAMIRQEMVDEEKWIAPERFNRVLAVYQVLPGPEAHELCVYFGMIARGRIGALLAGLGFMLPGFVLMLALSWFYVAIGVGSPIFQSVFLGMQPAVAALIVRAVHRIGGHALHDHNWLWGIAFTAALAQLFGVNFLITLFISGLIYTFATRQQKNHHMDSFYWFCGLSHLNWIFRHPNDSDSTRLNFRPHKTRFALNPVLVRSQKRTPHLRRRVHRHPLPQA